MVFGPDERAQSTLVGFILLFGILTIAFSSYQAVVVPNQNAEVEFNHFQDIQDDFTEFRSTLINSVGATDDRSVTFRLGDTVSGAADRIEPTARLGATTDGAGGGCNY